METGSGRLDESIPAELLAAARGGDGDAFARLVTTIEDELRAHCYRMLGSYTTRRMPYRRRWIEHGEV